MNEKLTREIEAPKYFIMDAKAKFFTRGRRQTFTLIDEINIPIFGFNDFVSTDSGVEEQFMFN